MSKAAWLVLAFLVPETTSSHVLRVDCRYPTDGENFCYASALYSIHRRHGFEKINYGVGCKRETLYDESGTVEPQELTSDSIRPKNSATPRIQIWPQGALQNPGSYVSKLELDTGFTYGGICYVRAVSSDDW